MEGFSAWKLNLQKPSAIIWFWISLLVLLQNSKGTLSASNYLIGLGSYDITGPAADVNMMGYANTDQIAAGVHFRLRARAFIVAEPNGNCVVFVNLDACMASQLVTIKVLERLKARFGNLYTENNVAISGIHTHAGPGGYLQYVVYIVTSLGFVRQSFDVIVDGIEQSIIQAHENLRPGSIFVDKGEILDAGVNRSPSAYLNNPAAERSKYKFDVDKEMTLLKFVDDEWGPVGSFNWFATHGTSMSRTNSLISGDNKGAAARFMEDWFNKNGVESAAFDDSEAEVIPRRVSNIIRVAHDNHHELLELAASFRSSSGKRATRFLSVARRVRSALRQADKPRFVSAFCQTNCGDVSPNVLGAFCVDTGLPCDFNQSTCGEKNELCYGRGPGYPDEFESTRIIGERQFKKASELFNKASEQLKGKVDYRHTYVDFSKLEVTLPKQGGGSEVVKTCPAAMGFAFAAGTTDGPGAFDFKQGDNEGNAFWKLVRDLLKTPGKEQIACQHPKPILLDTGEMKLPYDWAPSILPIQILRIGQLVILTVPGEFTTMAGRHLRDAVKTVLTSSGHGEFDENVHVVIAGLTNTYSQYVTTFEEYQVQRYELCTLPLDTAKVRLQLQKKANIEEGAATSKYRGMLGTVATIAREEGLIALWNGVIPGFHRQFLYGGLRIGLYEPVKAFFVGSEYVGDVSLFPKILAALFTGALAIAVANPTDLVKVRLQAENLMAGMPRRYSGALNAYYTIVKQEGLAALWTGLGPNIARNAIINAAELASYDQVKQTILKFPGFTDSVFTHLLAGLGAGFFAVCIGSPVDVVKSRMMGDSIYKSTLDCFIRTLKTEGPSAFYKGFLPNFGRLGIWNVIMFLTLEQAKKFFVTAD